MHSLIPYSISLYRSLSSTPLFPTTAAVGQALPASHVAIETVVKAVTVLVVLARHTETVTVNCPPLGIGDTATFSRAVVPIAEVLPVIEEKYTHPWGVTLIPTQAVSVLQDVMQVSTEGGVVDWRRGLEEYVCPVRAVSQATE